MLKLLVVGVSLLLTSCSAIDWTVRHPTAVPHLEPVPPLSNYEALAGDCGLFSWAGTHYKETPWSSGLVLSTVLKGMDSPATDAQGKAECAHVVVPPGAWVQAQEGRDRFHMVVGQREKLLQWIEVDSTAQQAEWERTAVVVKELERKRRDAFFIGLGVGAGAVLVGTVAVVLRAR